MAASKEKAAGQKGEEAMELSTANDGEEAKGEGKKGGDEVRGDVREECNRVTAEAIQARKYFEPKNFFLSTLDNIFRNFFSSKLVKI